MCPRSPCDRASPRASVSTLGSMTARLRWGEDWAPSDGPPARERGIPQVLTEKKKKKKLNTESSKSWLLTFRNEDQIAANATESMRKERSQRKFIFTPPKKRHRLRKLKLLYNSSDLQLVTRVSQCNWEIDCKCFVQKNVISQWHKMITLSGQRKLAPD